MPWTTCYWQKAHFYDIWHPDRKHTPEAGRLQLHALYFHLVLFGIHDVSIVRMLNVSRAFRQHITDQKSKELSALKTCVVFNYFTLLRVTNL